MHASAKAVVLGGYCAEARALFARFTTAPDGLHRRAYDRFIRTLKNIGIWSKFDALWVCASHDAQAGQRNLIADQFNLSPINAVNFVADRGFSSDGSSSYLLTGAAPSALTKYTQNDAHHSVTVIGHNATSMLSRVAAGAPDLSIASGGTWNARINAASGSGFSYTSSASHNDFTAVRSINTQVDAYHNGVSLGGTSTNSSARSAEVLTLLTSVGSYSNARLAIASLGGAPTAAEAAAFYQAKVALLRSIGAIA